MDEESYWHQDDEFWKEHARFMFNEEAWANTPDEVTAALELLGVERGAKFLDLACGPGRHSLELARRGYRVTGVDRTAAYLEEAGRRAAADSLEIEFVREDMLHFRRSNTFDGAWSMFTSFGYFDETSDNQQVLDNV